MRAATATRRLIAGCRLWAGLAYGRILILVLTGYFVGKYQTADRLFVKLVVLSTTVVLAPLIAYAILVIFPISLLL